MMAAKIVEKEMTVVAIHMAPVGIYIGDVRVVAFAHVEARTKFEPERQPDGRLVQTVNIELMLEPMVCVGQVVARVSSVSKESYDFTGKSLRAVDTR